MGEKMRVQKREKASSEAADRQDSRVGVKGEADDGTGRSLRKTTHIRQTPPGLPDPLPRPLRQRPEPPTERALRLAELSLGFDVFVGHAGAFPADEEEIALFRLGGAVGFPGVLLVVLTLVLVLVLTSILMHG